jgi:hypothetical protein
VLQSARRDATADFVERYSHRDCRFWNCGFRIEFVHSPASRKLPGALFVEQGIGLFGASALVLSIPFSNDFISCPRRRPVAIMIAQGAIDERGKKYQRSEEIHGFESHRILPYSFSMPDYAFISSRPSACTVGDCLHIRKWLKDVVAIFVWNQSGMAPAVPLDASI